MKNDMSRRNFLKFLGAVPLVLTIPELLNVSDIHASETNHELTSERDWLSVALNEHADKLVLHTDYNDYLTRKRTTEHFSEFLRKLRVEEKIYDWSVVCNELNNPPILVDENVLLVDIGVREIREIYHRMFRFKYA